jgi:5-formyltetrahydrofolate cyclo-ligase
MALGYDFQVLDDVPVEEGDRPVGLIITEKRSIRI